MQHIASVASTCARLQHDNATYCSGVWHTILEPIPDGLECPRWYARQQEGHSSTTARVVLTETRVPSQLWSSTKNVHEILSTTSPNGRGLITSSLFRTAIRFCTNLHRVFATRSSRTRRPTTKWARFVLEHRQRACDREFSLNLSAPDKGRHGWTYRPHMGPSHATGLRNKLCWS